MKSTFRTNNFDLIRLLAALQVALYHVTHHLHVELPSAIATVLAYFPGVPIFFFVSGFLISKSYESNSRLADYAQNRVLRIYPALIVCTLVAVLAVAMTGYLARSGAGVFDVLLWLSSQVTFVQFYNPAFMRDFGTGVLNGSLWTITVELQFYLVVPVLYAVFGLARSRRPTLTLVLLAFGFMLLHDARHRYAVPFGETLWFKLFSVSFLPWIWMFLVGIVFQKHFALAHRALAGRALWLVPLYVALAWLSVTLFGARLGNGLNPVLYLILAAATFSFAYSWPTLSARLLRGNDISYGLYIYHVPVINLLIYYGWDTGALSGWIAVGASVLLAVASWLLIEKPSLRLKSNPLNPLRRAGNAKRAW